MMKHFIAAAVTLLLIGFNANAQVIILGDNIMTGRLSEIHATVVDSLTNEPISFASAYVIPAKDTSISNFTLSNVEGKVKLEEVPYGNYIFHIEMLGYRPFIKEQYFRDRIVEMGTIKLAIDENYLKAAVVTDVGNPIVVKKDTVEFSASSFQVGTNAMLKDLLKRMPGMEVTEDGKVKFNGEEIDKLTVGGRTFFFGDQSTALNNLPASIVDKVRVIDRESESTRATGLEDGNREKVLDVSLKKEFEKGWFGNAGIKGGTTLAGGGDDPLRDDRGLLYSGNVLASAYSEKDQFTIIGNGMNINDSNGVVFVAVGSDGERTRISDVGLSSAAQLGVNVNTSRIKNVQTTVGANYKYGDTQTGSSSARTTFQNDGDLFSTSGNSGRNFSNSLSANMEFQKESGNVRFHFRPMFSYSKRNSHSFSSSETMKEGASINNSESKNSSLDTGRSFFANGDLTFRDLGGKKNRVLSIISYGSLNDEDGESLENSFMKMVSGEDSRSLKYLSESKTYSVNGGITYGEPIGEKWTVSTNTQWSYSKNDRKRDAFDAAGPNDYFSSESHNRSISQRYGMTAQYKFKERSWLTFGARLNGMLNETYSKSFNVSDNTGVGEWNWFVSPDISFQYAAGMNRFFASASGSNQRPGNASMTPTMNIIDPARPTLGNIYLKPYGNTYMHLSWNSNNREKFSTLMAYLFGNLNTNPISYARWYDGDGILYSIPVNSKKNSMSLSGVITYTTPLDAKKKWFLSTDVGLGFSASTSYQAKGNLKGLDKDSFDYSSFMESFWGGKDGDIFYSGKSGFEESTTRNYSPDFSLSLKYTSGSFSGRVESDFSGRIARYSLDDRVNMNTLDSRIGAGANYRTKHEFEFDTDIAYAWYRGYAKGYGAPEWQWNGEISKNIKAFNLSIKINDILNQTRNLTHTVTANYEEDTYRLVMGRYILFGVKWNFGKMNAAHSQRAQRAAFNMVF